MRTTRSELMFGSLTLSPRLRRAAAAVSLALIVVGVDLPANARSPSQVACTGGPASAPDAIIAGCTAAIKSGSGQNLALAYEDRGRAYARISKYDLAIQDYDRVIGIKSDNADAYIDRGIAYGLIGQYDLAIKDLDLAIRLKPDLVVAYHGRGQTYRLKGDYNRAIQDYDQAIKMKPDETDLYIDLGNLYADQGQYDRAMQVFDKLLLLQPSADAYNGRCWARAVSKHDLEALADCNASLRLRPDDANTLQSRSFVYLQLGRYDEAIADGTAALAQKANFADALYVRGLARIANGDRARGLADVSAATALKPEIAATYARYGVTGSVQPNAAQTAGGKSTLPDPETCPTPFIVQPKWVKTPQVYDMNLLYPPYARGHGKTDTVVMSCYVLGDGHLSECRVIIDANPGLGFDRATLSLAPYFQTEAPSSNTELAKAPSCEGSSGQARVTVSFHWTLN